MTKGIFNLCEYTLDDIEHEETGQDASEIAKGVASRGVSKFLIVSPTHDTLDGCRGYKYRRPLAAKTEVVNTMKFCK